MINTGSTHPASAAKAPAPVRVLLIDNDELNLLLAHEIFEQAGVQAVAVRSLADARQTLDAGQAFDCVFLDPGFDGLHNCRLLHELRAIPKLAELPVVGLLAHAEASESNPCSAAGIRLFVQKPLGITQVEATLAELFPPVDQAPKDGWQTWGQGENKLEFPLSQAIQIGQALKRFGGNSGLLVRILDRFHADQRGAAAALKQALNAGDLATAERLAHSLKGAAGNIDAHPLVEAAKAVEFALKNGDPELAQTLTPAVESTLDEVFRLLDQWQAGRGGAAPAEASAPPPRAAFDPAQARELLNQLQQPLERRRPVECEAALLEIKARQWPAELQAPIAELDSAIRRYRFRPAQQILSQIINRLGPGAA